MLLLRDTYSLTKFVTSNVASHVWVLPPVFTSLNLVDQVSPYCPVTCELNASIHSLLFAYT